MTAKDRGVIHKMVFWDKVLDEWLNSGIMPPEDQICGFRENR